MGKKLIADSDFNPEQFGPILLHEFLSSAAKKFPDKEAVITGNTRLSYADIEELSDNLASSLIKKGIKRHDRVIVFGDNAVETIISIYGILKAGAIFIILNGLLKST